MTHINMNTYDETPCSGDGSGDDINVMTADVSSLGNESPAERGTAGLAHIIDDSLSLEEEMAGAAMVVLSGLSKRLSIDASTQTYQVSTRCVSNANSAPHQQVPLHNTSRSTNLDQLCFMCSSFDAPCTHSPSIRKASLIVFPAFAFVGFFSIMIGLGLAIYKYTA